MAARQRKEREESLLYMLGYIKTTDKDVSNSSSSGISSTFIKREAKSIPIAAAAAESVNATASPTTIPKMKFKLLPSTSSKQLLNTQNLHHSSQSNILSAFKKTPKLTHLKTNQTPSPSRTYYNFPSQPSSSSIQLEDQISNSTTFPSSTSNKILTQTSTTMNSHQKPTLKSQSLAHQLEFFSKSRQSLLFSIAFARLSKKPSSNNNTNLHKSAQQIDFTTKFSSPQQLVRLPPDEFKHSSQPKHPQIQPLRPLPLPQPSTTTISLSQTLTNLQKARYPSVLHSPRIDQLRYSISDKKQQHKSPPLDQQLRPASTTTSLRVITATQPSQVFPPNISITTQSFTESMQPNRWKFNNPLLSSPLLLNSTTSHHSHSESTPTQLECRKTTQTQVQQPSKQHIKLLEIPSQVTSLRMIVTDQLGSARQSRRNSYRTIKNSNTPYMNLTENSSPKQYNNSKFNIAQESFSGAAAADSLIADSFSQMINQYNQTPVASNRHITSVLEQSSEQRGHSSRSPMRHIKLIRTSSNQGSPSVRQTKQSAFVQHSSPTIVIPPHTTVSPNRPSQLSKSLTKTQQLMSPTGSYLERRLITSQIHEDNYSVMQSTLLSALSDNEEVSHYVQQSGYSLDMFTFYMMKLYIHCSDLIVAALQKQKEQPSFSPSQQEIASMRSIPGAENPTASKPIQRKSLQRSFTKILEQSVNTIHVEIDNYETAVEFAHKFSTLKVNVPTLEFVRDVFCSKMRELSVSTSLVRAFYECFTGSMKLILPQSFLRDLGGYEKLRVLIVNLLEHLCYESGILQTFDDSLINEVTEAATLLLRSDSHLLQPYVERLKHFTAASFQFVSNAEFYQVKIAIGKIMRKKAYDASSVFSVQARIQKQRGKFFQGDDFSKDSAFNSGFLAQIAKNKRIAGYFLDPSSAMLAKFYDVLFGCLFEEVNYTDLVDFLEHHLKTEGEVPAGFLEELTKSILEAAETFVPCENQHQAMLRRKDVVIKMERVKQKAGVVSFDFLKFVEYTPQQLTKQIIEYCEDILIGQRLPEHVKESDVIKPQFIQEYLELIMSPEEQVFSIYDMEYAVTYHNINNFTFCFGLWVQALQTIIISASQLSDSDKKAAVQFITLNSFLN